MPNILDALSWLVTVRPIATILVLLAITIALGSGIFRLAPLAPPSVFLPEDSDVAAAVHKIDTLFGDSEPTVAVTMLFRGGPMTPEGLVRIERAVDAVETHALVVPLLAGPVVSPILPLAEALGTGDFASVPQHEIDAAVVGNPAFDRLVGFDDDGTQVALAHARLRVDVPERNAEAAEFAIREIVQSVDDPVVGSSLSAAIVSEEISETLGVQMLLLLIIALLVIAALLVLFTRSLLDLVLSMVGLVVTVVWLVGVQGWLGPNGAGLIGAPNSLTVMLPIMLVGLVVDYAIQSVALYREQLNKGQLAHAAVRIGLRSAIIPLTLAAATTMVSFFSSVSSPIPATRDLGIVAGIGVGFGLVVMLTLLASVKALIDHWRESRGSLRTPRPISSAIPAIGRALNVMFGLPAVRPAPFLAAVGIITIVFGIASRDIDTVFEANDFLPTSGEAIRDVETVKTAFGGSVEEVKVLIETELTDDRIIRNMIDFTEAFSDDLRRPDGVVGEIESSIGLLLADWITDDRDENDNYDPELHEMVLNADEFRLDPARIQSIVDRLEHIDPEGFAQVAVSNPAGEDILLFKFHALTGDLNRTRRMVDDVYGLWFGDDEALTPTSGEVVALEVVDAMTSSQTASITTTFLAALLMLVTFFWITKGRPALGLIAVAPIMLVLVWVLGTMALLGIPYNVVTAMITALSIGIGVDYTINIIHRYEEEFDQLREPEEAVRRTLATTGSALLGSALTTALGFGVLLFSSLTPFQQFGIVTAITIAYASAAAVIVVPPSMVLWAAYQNYRLRAAVARAERELPSEKGE